MVQKKTSAKKTTPASKPKTKPPAKTTPQKKTVQPKDTLTVKFDPGQIELIKTLGRLDNLTTIEVIKKAVLAYVAARLRKIQKPLPEK